MSQSPVDSILEDRIAQLNKITARRNELLRQMYYMIRHRDNPGSVLTPQEHDEDDLHVFLQKFDLSNNLAGGSILNLDDADILKPSSSHSPSASSEDYRVSEDKFVPALAESSSRGVDRTIISHHRPEDDDDHDELDLFGTPADTEHPISPVTLTTPKPIPNVPFTHHKDFSEDVKQRAEQAPQYHEPMQVDIDQDAVATHESEVGGISEQGPEHSIRSAPVPEFHRVDGTIVEQAQSSSGPITVEEHDQPTITPPHVEGEGSKQHEVEAVDIEMAEHEEKAVPAHREAQPISQLQQPEESTMDASEQRSSTSAPEGQQSIQDNATSIPITPTPSTINPSKILTPPSLPIIQPIVPAQRPILIIAPPTSPSKEPTFQFNSPMMPNSKSPSSPIQHRHQFAQDYTLPPLKSLPPEFNRKAKPTKLQRKREKEREKEGKKDGSGKEDWLPMGLNRWAATINVNPLWKKVSRSSKCLTTRDWAIAIAELRLVRTLDRVEALKDSGRWSFRQPKKHRGLGGLVKTHWDYLLDEMKWMRIDFREERKWKMAVAYNLSTSVLEWHALKSWDERIAQGVCVRWKVSYGRRPETRDATGSPTMEIDEPIEFDPSEQNAKSSALDLDYGSDDEGDDDEKRSVVDPLEPSNLIQEELENKKETEGNRDSATLEPKLEDVDDSQALHNEALANSQDSTEDVAMTVVHEESPKLAGLKTTSKDPMLGSKSNTHSTNGDTEQSVAPGKTTKANAYSTLRGELAYSTNDKLFMDRDDLDLAMATSEMSLGLERVELSDIFPDLQPFGILDVPSASTGSVEGRKKEKKNDKDDPNKRVEETTYTKLFPVGKFMHKKPTLIGPLQPSKRWKNGSWLAMDDSPVHPEADNNVKISDDSMSELFDSRVGHTQMNAQAALLALKDKEHKKKIPDHLWSDRDDALLKSFIDKYPNNWGLISECLNGCRSSIKSDKRTPRDCLERWKDKWSSEAIRQKPSEASAANGEDSAAPSLSMTTRGLKRSAGAVASSSTVAEPGGSDPKKRRRHLLLQETIRKATKRKMDSVQKNATQRKPAAVHETHNQFSKMQKLTPAELSRMKAEKDSRELQEVQLARRRQEELTRQMQAQRMGNAQAPQVQAAQQQQLAASQQAAQSQAQAQPQPAAQLPMQVQAQAQGLPVAATVQSNNGISRPPTTTMGVPQIRSQVNISRIATPGVSGTAGPRFSPQQLQQMQAAQAQVMAQAQVRAAAAGHQISQNGTQGQGQAQGAVNGLTVNGLGINGTHTSGNFGARDATSSPHLSPPRSSAAPSSGNLAAGQQQVNGQQGLLQSGAVAGNNVGRASSNPYYLPNMQGLTQEQIQAAVRLQMMSQAAAAQQYQPQAPASNGFPPAT